MLNGVVELHVWLCFPDVIVQRIRNIWAPVQLLDINHAFYNTWCERSKLGHRLKKTIKLEMHCVCNHNYYNQERSCYNMQTTCLHNQTTVMTPVQ